MNILLLTGLSLVSSRINMQIGAGGFGFGCGSNSPAAQLPYSYVRLGPDTAPLLRSAYFDFQHFGGYHTSDSYIRAFSHMRLVGAGVLDLGIFGLLPRKAPPSATPAIPKDPLQMLLKPS
jgi:putative alpha-1,2-mannosidase